MRKALTASAVLHLAAFILAILVVPMFDEKLDLEPAMIPIDIVEVGPMASPHQGEPRPEAPVPPAAKPAPHPPAEAAPPPPPPPPPPPKPQPPEPKAPVPEQPKPHEKPAPPKPEPAKPELPKPEPVKPVPVKPPPPKPEPAKPEPVKPPEKKPPEKKTPEKPPAVVDPLASVLSNIDKIKKDLAAKQPPTPAAPPSTAKPSAASSPSAVVADRLTGPELDALRGQISNNWNVDPGKAKAAEMIVDLIVDLNPDRTVKRAILAPKSLARANSDPSYKTSAEAAIRAVIRSSPLKIPIEKLGGDLRVTITFNPKDMF